MKKIKKLFMVLLTISLTLSCEKEEIQIVQEQNTMNNQNNTTKSATNANASNSKPEKFAYVTKNGTVFLLNNESQIKDAEVSSIVRKARLKFQSSSCVTANGWPGMKCVSTKKGDCTSEFSCIISYSGK